MDYILELLALEAGVICCHSVRQELDKFPIEYKNVP